MSKEDKTTSAATDLLEAYNKFDLSLTNRKQNHLRHIRRLNYILSRYQQSRVDSVGSPRVDAIKPPGVDQVEPQRVTRTILYPNSPTYQKVIRTTPRVHQRQTRRNTPLLTIMEVTDPLLATDLNLQTQIGLSSTTVHMTGEPTPKRFVPAPKHQSTATLPDKLVPAIRTSRQTRTSNGQQIGTKRNSSTNALRKRITSLITNQTKRYIALQQHVDLNNVVLEQVQTDVRFVTYRSPNPRGKPAPVAITQDKEEPNETTMQPTIP